MQAQTDNSSSLDEIPRAQRRPLTQPVSDFANRYPRNEAMARAYLSGQHSMAEIARHFGVHYSTVSRATKEHERRELKV